MTVDESDLKATNNETLPVGLVTTPPEQTKPSSIASKPTSVIDANLWYNSQASSLNSKKPRYGLIAASTFGLTGLLIMCIATPFVMPALRKHCLPYVPATDVQLSNLKRAIQSHAPRPGGCFLDIGSGDGRVCRMAAGLGMFNKVDGVELNYMLVLYSRLMSLGSKQQRRIRYHHKDLWIFPLRNYESVCIFGVESMMQPLEDYLTSAIGKYNKAPGTKTRETPQTIFACRFPFATVNPIDEIGHGIDTVWVYKL